MQELIINGLLTVVILTAVILRFFIGTRADSGMTKKQKTESVPYHADHGVGYSYGAGS